MSGGHWDYIQYRFTDVVEDVKSLVKKNGKLKTKEELSNGSYYNPEYFEKYPDEKYHAEYAPEVIEEFKKGIEIIAQAQIYMQRLDWMLSGDDGPETFLERLKEDLDNLKK